MHNTQIPDDLFEMVLLRLGMKQNILSPEQRTQVDDLVAALRDPQWSVRVAAAQALGRLAEQVPIEPLVAVLDDKHEAVRAAAARTLGKLGEQAPVEPLVKALHDPSWMVRSGATHALGKLGIRTPLQPLMHAMKDEDATVRATAIQALGAMGERAPVDDLITAFDDPEWSVREAIVLALGCTWERVPHTFFLKAVHDEDATVREAARIILQQTHLDGVSSPVWNPSSSSSQPSDAKSVLTRHAQVQANNINRTPLPLPTRKRSPRPLKRGLVALVAACLILASLAIFQRYFPPPTTGSNRQVGYISFISSQDDSKENSAAGYSDEVQIKLHDLRPPASGKSYYGWLLDDTGNPEGNTFPLGRLTIMNGNVQMFYPGDTHHTNLLATTNLFLITEQVTNLQPLVLSPDRSTWIYHSELDPKDTITHSSLLHDLRSLLAADPTLEAQGLHGGLNVWLKRNMAQVLDLVLQIQAASKEQNLQLLHNQLSNPDFNRLQQQLPAYQSYIDSHLRAIAGNPYATPDQKTSATLIIKALDGVKARLERVHADASQLLLMTDAQLLQSASLAIFEDIVTQATIAYNGQIDAKNQKLQQEGVLQIYQDIQKLATFGVKEYTI